MVSIIIPSYNKENYIEQAINSVLSQTIADWELIIVDDFSTDGTMEVLKKFEHQNNVHIFYNEINKGANYCRNFGFSKSTKPYIIFFDADDILEKNCLENRVKLMGENPSLDFAVFTMGIFNKKIGDNNYKWFPETKNPLIDFLQHKLPWQTMQPIYKKETLSKTSGFDEIFQRFQDVEFHTRILLNSNLNYKLINATPDCFLRIDASRNNLGSFQLQENLVDSSLKYTKKFSGMVNVSQKKYLFGTLYQTYMQLMFAHKNKELSKIEFDTLENKILNAFDPSEFSKLKRFHFLILKYNNLGSFKLKGLNYIMKKLIIYL